MTITHHPAPESLMSCSAGSMPEAFAAVMAAHMEMCPCCRQDLSLLEHVGTALFETLPPETLLRAAPVMTLRGLESDPAQPLASESTTAHGGVPGPLRSVLGDDLDKLAWKRVATGVWQHRIPLPDGRRGDLRLVKVAPGHALPEHGHRGSEITVVLRGSYRDATGEYKVGDVADLSDNVEHAPLADPVKGCICLIAMVGRMKFKSRIARLVQPLAGF